MKNSDIDPDRMAMKNSNQSDRQELRDRITALESQNKSLRQQLEAIKANPAGYFKSELDRLEEFYPKQLHSLQVRNAHLFKQLRDVRSTLQQIISQLPS